MLSLLWYVDWPTARRFTQSTAKPGFLLRVSCPATPRHPYDSSRPYCTPPPCSPPSCIKANISLCPRFPAIPLSPRIDLPLFLLLSELSSPAAFFAAIHFPYVLLTQPLLPCWTDGCHAYWCLCRGQKAATPFGQFPLSKKLPHLIPTLSAPISSTNFLISTPTPSALVFFALSYRFDQVSYFPFPAIFYLDSNFPQSRKTEFTTIPAFVPFPFASSVSFLCRAPSLQVLIKLLPLSFFPAPPYVSSSFPVFPSQPLLFRPAPF